MSRLKAIPCNVITGFLGVGKTTCILDLLTQKPEEERWAILVNEFGEIGLDGQLLEHADSSAKNVFIREVPGGCMCCSSGVPMQIALNLLLMKARPDRLLIEPTGLGHPREVIRTLQSEHYSQVLTLQTTLTLVNPRHFTSPKHLQNATFQQQLEVADILVVNKTDLATKDDIQEFEHYLAENKQLHDKPYIFTEKGHVPVHILNDATSDKDSDHLIQKNSLTSGFRRSIFKENSSVNEEGIAPKHELPDCGFLIEEHEADGFLSIGWRIESKQLFDLTATLDWLGSLKALRIKALLHCKEGWVSINDSRENVTGSNTEPVNSNTSHLPTPILNYSFVNNSEPTESRLEMIFEKDNTDLNRSGWQQCLWN